MLAFTFPGQGSQRPGMGRLWADHPSWEVVGEASELAGRDVAALLVDADADELTLTANAQLATFALGLVVLDAIERVGLAPTLCAGHSLGEYTALVASGALPFEDGIRLVVARGEAMHDAAEERPGVMAAVLGADDDAVEAACQRAEGDVWVANYNAPGQVVIAGDGAMVERAGAIAKELGARKVMPFPVAGAFHTPFMAPARSRLRKALGDARLLDPEVPVVANVDGRVHEHGTEWSGLLSAQLCSPVRWRQTLDTLAHLGAATIVEVGPGGVLAALARRTLRDVRSLAVATPADLDALVAELAGGDAPQPAADHHGEHLFASERVVVSPSAGIFEPHSGLDAPGPGGVRGLRVGGASGGRPRAAPSPPAGPGTAGAGTDVGDDPVGLPATREVGDTVGTVAVGDTVGTVAVGDTVGTVAVGDVVGMVGDVEVRTPFAGRLVGFLAHGGERVMPGQPVAWLRITSDDQ